MKAHADSRGGCSRLGEIDVYTNTIITNVPRYHSGPEDSPVGSTWVVVERKAIPMRKIRA